MADYDDEKVRILVVDDEEALCDTLQFNLEAEGYETDVAHSAEDALALDLSQYSLIILDIMMGDISGEQMARIMRRSKNTADIPIIFCTARDTEDDMVNGLELGGDDYVTKPFSMRNMLARVKSVLRRSRKPSQSAGETTSADAPATLSYKGLVVVPDKKVCMVNGVEVRMPKKEFEILLTLMQHPGRVFSREELLAQIWPDEVVVLARVVDVNITRLRAKIGEYGKKIVTRPGYGYGFID